VTGNNRPQIVNKNRNILLTVNVSSNWGECSYSKVGNTSPKHSRELYVSVFIWDNYNTVKVESFQSPDLNIIENVCKEIKKNIAKRILEIQTKEDLV
jgi:hypothetical protein